MNYNFKSMKDNLRIDDLFEFREEAEKVINSEFNKNIQVQFFTLKDGNKQYNLLINDHKIEVKCYDNFISDISYIVDKDVINIPMGNNNSVSIYKALNLEVPKFLLNDYHRNLIDSNPISFKNVYIESYIRSLDSVDLNICDDKSYVLLKKVNKIID